MARGKRSERGLRRWQRDAAAMAFALFPMLAMAGLFSPAVVHVEEDLVEPAPRPRVVEFANRSGHRALLIPRDFSAGFMPGLLDMDRMFRDSGISSNVSRRSLIPFPRHNSDSIVMTDVHTALPGFLFKDPLGVTSALGLIALPAYDDLVLEDGNEYEHTHLRRGKGKWKHKKKKDPPQPPVVPEPGTGLLLGFGLALLAARRRPTIAR